MAKTQLGDALVVRLETDLKPFEKGMDTATRRVQVFDKTAGAASTGATRFARSTDGVAKSAKQAGGGMGELRESFASLVSQMAGVHPVSGKLLSVFGSLAVGSGVMIGVLGGIAALGAAFKFLTRDITSAKEAAEKNMATLDKLAEKARGGEIAELNKGIVEAEPRLRRLSTLLGALRAQRELSGDADPSAQERELQAEYDELAFKVGLATARIKELVAEKIKDNNDAYAKGVKSVAQAHNDAAVAVEKHTGNLADLVAETRKLLGLQHRIPLLLPSGGGTVNAPVNEQQIVDDILGRIPPPAPSTSPSRMDLLGQNVQLGAAAQQIQQVAQAAAAGLGPFAVLIPIINSALQALEPVLTKIIQPLANIGVMLAATLQPQLEAIAKGLRFLTIVVSYVNQAIGWFVRSLGKAINFLLPGNPANGLVRFGQSMIDASKQARDFSEQANAMTASMRNVPLSFNTQHAAYRVGMGDTGRTAMTRASDAGAVTIHTLNIVANHWSDIKREMATAAAGGDPLARALQRAG